MITLPDDLAEQIAAYAEREKLTPETVIREAFALLKQRTPTPPREDDTAMPPMDARSIRLRTYARARQYWHEAGDLERAALTDERLDEQFWVFDNEGIPRLKADQAFVTVIPSPLLKLASEAEQDEWTSERDDISENFDEILGDIVAEKIQRMRDNR